MRSELAVLVARQTGYGFAELLCPGQRTCRRRLPGAALGVAVLERELGRIDVAEVGQRPLKYRARLADVLRSVGRNAH